MKEVFQEPEMLSYVSTNHIYEVVNMTPVLRISVSPLQCLASFLRWKAIRVVSGKSWSLNLSH